LKADLRTNTERLAGVIARAISEQPEQWMVFEPMWPGGADVTARESSL
jgi:lauroyl/myristoyl acyltransferase